MVYLHFPTTLTPEELLLKDKYAILRKKKKALQDMKAPKAEPEKVNPLKRPLDPKDAKEFAKKLILQGKLTIPSRPTIEKTVFKRSRILERKITSTGRTEGHGGMTPGYASSYHAEPHFEPFTPQLGDKDPLGGDSSSKGKFSMPASKYSFGAPKEKDTAKEKEKDPAAAEVMTPPPPKSALPKSFFTPPKDTFTEPTGGGGSGSGPTPKVQNRPKRGPTIYVGAQDLSEDILKAVFDPFGKIVNVKIHSQNVGFVSFETAEIAERAITEINGSTHNDSTYDVQFARRQPSMTQLLNESSASASWMTIANSQSNKGGHEDKRKQVVYDEVDEVFMGE